MIAVFWKGIKVGHWVEDEYIPLVSGGNTGVSGYIAASENRKAGHEAASAEREANQQAIAEQQREYDQTRQDLMPYTKAGQQATAQLSDLMGYNGTDAQNKAYAAFRNDPGYQFAFQQGQQALNRQGAAGGYYNSGRMGAALTNYGQGMADQQFNNYYSRIFNTANMGRGTAMGVAQLGQNTANNVSGLYSNLGNINAQGAMVNANSIQQMSNYADQTNGQVIGTAANIIGSIYGRGGQNNNLGNKSGGYY